MAVHIISGKNTPRWGSEQNMSDAWTEIGKIYRAYKSGEGPTPAAREFQEALVEETVSQMASRVAAKRVSDGSYKISGEHLERGNIADLFPELSSMRTSNWKREEVSFSDIKRTLGRNLFPRMFVHCPANRITSESLTYDESNRQEGTAVRRLVLDTIESPAFDRAVIDKLKEFGLAK